MITLIPIEPLSDAHGMLIVKAFNRFFIDRGGKEDGNGDGDGYGYGDGNGWGDGNGNGNGNGNGWGNGYGWGDGDGYGCVSKCPEEWQAD